MVGWLFAGAIGLWLCLLVVVVALCRAADERRDAWREERLRTMGEVERLERTWESS